MKTLEYHVITTDEIHEVIDWKYEEDYAIYNLPAYEVMEKQNIGLANLEKRKNYYSFYDEDILVGFINLHEESNAVFLGIGVNPSELNKKYGQRILKQAIAISKKLYNDKPIYLEVRTWNKRAINSYKKAGFEVLDTITLTTNIGKGEFYRMVYYP